MENFMLNHGFSILIAYNVRALSILLISEIILFFNDDMADSSIVHIEYHGLNL